MIKKIIFIATIATFGFATYFFLPENANLNSVKPTTHTKPENVRENNTKSFIELTYDGSTYSYAYRKTTSDVLLVPNFDSRLTSTEIFTNHDCAYGLNGGFYTKENTPLGLFYADNKFYGQNITSNTFNVYLAKSKTSQSLQILTSIENLDIENTYDFVFQTGPIFDLKSDYVANFDDQEYARRSLVAKDSDGAYYFFIIFDKESRYSGPRLQDIVPIFRSDDLRQISDFDTVINVDGGSASAYYDRLSETKISEITPIGSFMCGVASEQ